MANKDDNSNRLVEPDYRKEFLLRIYEQMFNDINRHILVIWQSVGILVGAFAIFALAEKKIISVDIASALIVLISAWLIAHVIDSNYWYNRNLGIIANIERQFLTSRDLRDIHYYFGKHRKVASMLSHLFIQYLFGIGIATLVLLYHFLNRVLPEIRYSKYLLPHRSFLQRLWQGDFELEKCLPYLVLIVCLSVLLMLRKKRMEAYKEFLKNSPGIEVDTEGIDYGRGHPSA